MPKMNEKGEERAYGVYRATVTDEDPNGGGRVKVRPAEPGLLETWARVATLQLPAKDEEVVIAFERGDPRQPYVVGSLWSETGDPPTASRVILRDKNGNTIGLEPAGIRVNTSAEVSVTGSTAEISVGGLTVSAGMSRFSGVVQADTVITNSVVASSYTPGAGNIW
jgi:phage baseplate assembly protein gpV